MVNHILAYGTLRTGASNHSNASVDKNTKSLGIVEIFGYKMYRVANNGMGSSDYPGIVYTGLSTDSIIGELFKIVGSPEAQSAFLSSLDLFENDAEIAEYERVNKKIIGFDCYLYEYILPVGNFSEVPNGDWLNS
jgi:gamma-glutamylcyclotransferase (GGCT)/AIG2-like uncharacterized protein YtfP